MRPVFTKRNPEKNSAFRVWRNTNPYLHQSWHYHDELEIAYIEKGSGTRFIGDSVQPYEEGELILMGSNLPHEWKSDFQDGPAADHDNASLALYFLQDFPGNAFYELPKWTGSTDYYGYLCAVSGSSIPESSKGFIKSYAECCTCAALKKCWRYFRYWR